eukprot:3434718-Rhodomonas_salina.1
MKAGPGATAYIEKGDYEHALDCELLTVRGNYLHTVPVSPLAHLSRSHTIASRDLSRDRGR